MHINLIFLALLLASCSGLSMPSVSPYKMDIHQGNLLTPAMREDLKLGMTKQQVRYLLGTPLVNDAYHGDRWDYVYRLEQGRKLVDKQRLTLYFGGDKLAGIDDGISVVGKLSTVAEPEITGSPNTVDTLGAGATESVVKSAGILQPVARMAVVADIQSTLYAWAEVWSAKDVKKYLAFYAPDFEANGMGRADWERLRTSRISQPKLIKVKLESIKVTVLDASHATAAFTQTYRSDRYQDVTRKIMSLEKTGGAWLIVSEQVAK